MSHLCSLGYLHRQVHRLLVCRSFPGIAHTYTSAVHRHVHAQANILYTYDRHTRKALRYEVVAKMVCSTLARADTPNLNGDAL